MPDVTEAFSAEEEHVTKLSVEIVDFVFYACDAYRLLQKRYPWLDDMDTAFEWKMKKNMERPKQYGAKFIEGLIKQLIDHYKSEGLLPKLIEDFMSYATESGI